MNRIDFSHAGGFPLETDTFDFLQKSLADPIKALSALGGDNYIISGVIETNGKVSDGWVVINGEILPFKGDFKQNTVIVTKTAQKVTFENGTKRDVYFTHQAMFGAGLESIPFASMPRISDLQTQKKKADELNDRVEKLERGTLIPGMIMAWKGSVDDGTGQFKYNPNPEPATTLTSLKINPNPNRYYDPNPIPHAIGNSGCGVNNAPCSGHPSIWKRKNIPPITAGNQPHNNMPPYYALAYIEYVG